MLRQKVAESPYCELRTGCQVTGRCQTHDEVVATYQPHSGPSRKITAYWLVGADGKKGVVRKHDCYCSCATLLERMLHELVPKLVGCP